MRNPLILPPLFALLLAGLGAQAQTPSDPPSSPPPLKILLTNDDGVGGTGMLILRDALCAAGHLVTVVAPSADSSGSSAALGLNVTFRATRTDFTCGSTPSAIWAVGGSPSDSVLFGLALLGDQRPDLVISGMNFGQNVGRAVNHSGTVGAAVTAAEEGIPALAVSIAINVQDSGTGFSQTVAAAPFAAALVNELISKLRNTSRPGGPLLPDRVALNVNYPVLLDAQGQFAPTLIQGMGVTSVGHGEVVHPQYMKIPNTADQYFVSGSICGLSVTCAPETQGGADTDALESGVVSVSPLVVDGVLRPWLNVLLSGRLR